VTTNGGRGGGRAGRRSTGGRSIARLETTVRGEDARSNPLYCTSVGTHEPTAGQKKRGKLGGGSKKRALEPTAPCHCILSQTALPSLIRAPGQKQETHARAALDWFFIPCVDGLFPRLLMTRWHFRRPSFADASAPTRKKAANGRARRHPLASTRRPHALACVRDEDVLRSVHVRARHAGVLRGRRADVRVLRREVRRSEASARGKKKRRWMAPAKSPRLGRRGAGAPASTLDPGRGAPRRARRASGRRPRDVRRSVADPLPSLAGPSYPF